MPILLGAWALDLVDLGWCQAARVGDDRYATRFDTNATLLFLMVVNFDTIPQYFDIRMSGSCTLQVDLGRCLLLSDVSGRFGVTSGGVNGRAHHPQHNKPALGSGFYLLPALGVKLWCWRVGMRFLYYRRMGRLAQLRSRRPWCVCVCVTH